MSKFPPFECKLESFIDRLQQKIQNNYKTIEQLLTQEKKTFANFVKPLELMEEELEHLFTPLSHLNAVNNSKHTQEVYTGSLPIITEYSTKLSQDLRIYKAFKEIQKNESTHSTTHKSE